MDHSGEATVAGELSQPEQTKHLTAEEVLAKLDSLSAEDKIRLRLIERRRLGGTDFQEGLLYQEAVCQAILGERRCPRATSFVAFLVQSMRSIASHRREELARQVQITKSDDAGNVVEMQLASDQLDPEATLIEQEATDIVAEIYNCLEGDDEAQLTIMEIVKDKKGKELRDALGIDQAHFDYIMKRIRRVMAKKYPSGWLT
jgi:DNA-directed RNA polymerase specialized sigma24 family protein